MKLGWIDFSETDRRRAIDVIHMLTEAGAMDELGIGIVRDAFSDLFFPGISTIQTRAKYFFISPYAIEDACLNPRNFSAKGIVDDIDRIEYDCSLKMREGKQSSDGIIGATLADRWVIRKPYNIYWNGLKTFGILKQNVSLYDIARYYEELKRKTDNTIKGKAMEDDTENSGDDIDAGTDRRISFWNLPEHSNWRDNLDIELTQAEAEFLKERIQATCRERLLGIILANHDKIDILAINSFEQLCEAAAPYVDDSLRYKMKLAREFSDFSFLIGTTYNRFLIGEENVKDALDRIEKDKERYLAIDLDEMFSALNLWRYGSLHTFLKDAHRALSNGDINLAHSVLRKQEVRLKGLSRAKLASGKDYSRWVGLGSLDYRFYSLKTILGDIYNALNV